MSAAPKKQRPQRKAPKAPSSWDPSIVVFACNWCSYAGADTAGVSRIQHQPHFRMIRVMCSGRIQPAFVLRAFEKGADGVYVLGCMEGECHFNNGNFRARKRVEQAQTILDTIGVGGERAQMFNLSSAEGPKFAKFAVEMTERIQKLGPNPIKKGKKQAA